jgi:hypothetical protein
VFPARAGATVTAQRLAAGGKWVASGRGRVSTGGSYSLPVPVAGSYRSVYDGTAGPTVSVG